MLPDVITRVSDSSSAASQFGGAKARISPLEGGLSGGGQAVGQTPLQAAVKEEQLKKTKTLVPNSIFFGKWHTSLTEAFSWYRVTARLALPNPTSDACRLPVTFQRPAPLSTTAWEFASPSLHTLGEKTRQRVKEGAGTSPRPSQMRGSSCRAREQPLRWQQHRQHL